MSRSLARARSTRGFTLVELLVATAVSSVVILAITMAFLAQVQQYRRHVNLRSAQAGSRQSIAMIQDKVRKAGYGVDPDRAIIAWDSFDPGNPTSQAVDYPDAITVHFRQPNFTPRKLTSVTDSALEWDGSQQLVDKLRTGQILLVMCAGASPWAYVTVGADAAAGANRVALVGAGGTESPIGMPGPRFRENAKLTADPCFNQPGSLMLAVERASFFVAEYDVGGAREPYLMLHKGTDTDENGSVGLSDASPVAADVEQLQVAYILNTLDSNPPLVLGVSAADVPWGDTWATAALSAPRMDSRYTDAARISSHPANIRQVRVTLVARGTAGSEEGDNYNDPTSPVYQGQPMANGQVPWRQMENLGGAPAVLDPKGGHFARRVMRVSILPKNLLMRSQFLPPNPGGS